MNIKETKQILRILEGAYNTTFGDSSEVVWQGVFEDVPASEVKMAVLACIRLEPFCPSPAKVNLYLKYADGENPADIWERLVKLASQGDSGFHKYQANESKAVQKALYRVGGFDYLRRCSVDSLNYTKNYFIEAYNDISKTERVQEALNASKRKLLLINGKGEN